MSKLLTQKELAHTLAIPDLTDPLVSTHALQKLIRLAERALTQHWQCQLQTVRSSPVVPVENNYDRLNYPSEGAARDARYTRYISERYILRTQTSSAIPDTLAGMRGSTPADLLLMVPGMVYRRDSIDRLHCAEPHQLDIWRLVDHQKQRSVTQVDLHDMVDQLMSVLLPDHEWRAIPSPHPYTEHGVQIDVRWRDEWIEVGECGLIDKTILQNAALNVHSGLAMGLGLDRILMIRKNIPDIRLIRSTDSRVLVQMDDLALYRPVSMMPPIYRDLSLAVSKELSEEDIGDRIRSYLKESESIECLQVISETDYDELPASAQQRMGMQPHQKNMLLKVVIRDMNTTLSAEKANDIRNKIYGLLHEGIRDEVALNR